MRAVWLGCWRQSGRDAGGSKEPVPHQAAESGLQRLWLSDSLSPPLAPLRLVMVITNIYYILKF